MTAAAHRILVGELQDALDLEAVVEVGVEGGVAAVAASLLPEIHAAGQFAYAEEVRAVHELLLKGALVDQGLEGLHGAQVGIEAEGLAHREQALLGPYLRGRVVVISGVADGAEKDRVALQADLMGAVGIGGSEFVDGAGAHLGEGITHFVAEARAYGVHGLDGLGDHFRPDAVTGQFGDSKFHRKVLISRFSIRFNILTVALMAASVWSESMPRVLNSWSPSRQEMAVETRASVLPPGGMLTW